MAFAAQYPGICDACEGDIKPGQMIRNSTEAQRAGAPYEHAECPSAETISTEKYCSRCFLFHAGECPW